MALLINDDCVACGSCEAMCPNSAISEGDGKFVIDPAKCKECKGSHPEPQCASVCPVGACVPDPAHPYVG